MKGHLMNALTLTRGNQRQAAALLGVTRWKLGRLIVRLGPQDFVMTARNAGDHVAHMPEPNAGAGGGRGAYDLC
jgi:hypothetical protein